MKGHNYGPNRGGGNTGKWRGRKGQFYEGGIRVPAMIRYPRTLPKGVVRDQVVTACDWLPTILGLCNVKHPAKVELDGASLLPIIRDNAPTHHKVLHWGWQTRWAVREGDWKLIGTKEKPVALVNLAENRPEMKNHLADDPETVTRLHKLHDAWVAKVTREN